MKVSVEVHKIIKCAICSTIIFPSGGGIGDVLVRLSLIEQITTDISGIINEFVQYVQNYFQYVYIPI